MNNTTGFTQFKLTICPICGGSEFIQNEVLWEALIEEWGLSVAEVAYINQQQGYVCNSCHSNLRSMTLAGAFLHYFGETKHPFTTFCKTSAISRQRSILEINEAGSLTPYLKNFKKYELASYPEVDMQQLPHADNSVDLIVHSDTLEHVPNSIQALAENHRVLKPGGCLFFTIPIIYGRMSRKRIGLSPSYHGASGDNKSDFIVHTEYGADFWVEILSAGFTEVRLFSLKTPNSLAIMAVK